MEREKRCSTNGSVLVEIELIEYSLDALIGIVIALSVLLAREIINGLDELMHLLLIDGAVAVRIVELEAHLQLLPNVAAACRRDGDQVLEEVDLARVIGVEHVEDLRGELLRFALRVELFEHVRELLLVEFAFGTIFLSIATRKQKKLLINSRLVTVTIFVYFQTF